MVATNENRYGNYAMSWTKNIFIKYNDIKLEIQKGQILKLNEQRLV